MVVTNLGLVVELGGAIVGNILMFITPGLCYYRLHRDVSPRPPLCSVALGMALLGALLVPLGIAVTFL